MKRKIINCEQGSPEWHALRVGRITASIAHRLLTPAKLKTLYRDIMAERTTGAVPDEVTGVKHMEAGKQLEPVARAWYEFEHDVEIAQVGFVVFENDNLIGCSPDGLVGDDGLLEIKCPGRAAHFEHLSAGITKEYYAQVQFQLMFFPERQWCDFLSYNPDYPVKLQHHVERHERDDDMIGDFEKGLKKFREMMSKCKVLNKSKEN